MALPRFGIGFSIMHDITAPWVARALVRRAGFATDRLFALCNLLGILDPVVAVGLGGLNFARASGDTGERRPDRWRSCRWC